MSHDDTSTEKANTKRTGLTRRTFLRRSAGAMALLAATRALDFDALAQEASRSGNQFFTPEEAEIFAAIAERIWPGDDEDPGAREAGAAAYVDRALAGPYAEYQQVYQVILDDVRQTAQSRYGTSVADLDEDRLDDLLRELETRGGGDGSSDDPLATFRARSLDLTFGPASSFELLRKHTMEGVFADPVHGGNRDFAGWRAVGYPGAHYVYTAEEQQVFEPLEKPFQSVGDL